jgi:hypothetical protein
LPGTLVIEEQTETFSTFVEVLKNIENRVAWFLAELCKAEKRCAKRQAKPATDRAR